MYDSYQIFHFHFALLSGRHYKCLKHLATCPSITTLNIGFYFKHDKMNTIINEPQQQKEFYEKSEVL
jgi:hypothetical protein